MKYLSVCSGIEAASVAWEPLGWEAVGFSEIEPFPCAVLAHHYPHVPLHGDFTALIQDPPSCDVLVGGTPCQAFSVAGARQSLDDARGNLSLAYVMLANAIDRKNHAEGKEPCITVWENVPGVFSTKDNAFGFFLRGLAGSLPGEDGPLEPPGGKWTHCGAVLGPQRAVAWRVLDAQYFGLAQRRQRVFVVASARNGFDPTAVLLEWEGVRRDSAPSREARENLAAASGVSPAPRGGEHAGGRDGRVETPCPDPAGPIGGAGQSGGFRTTDLDNNGSYIVGSFPWPQDVDPLTTNEAKTYTHEGTTFRTRNVVPHVVASTSVVSALTASGRGVERPGESRGQDPLVVHIEPQGFYTTDGRFNGIPPAGLSPPLKVGTGTGGTSVAGVAHVLVAASQDEHVTARVPAYADALRGREGGNTAEMGGDIQPALRTGGGGSDKPHVLVFEPRYYTRENKTAGAPDEHVTAPLRADLSKVGDGFPLIATSMVVRRLTPRECERLQGFPDDWTIIPWRGKPCPDGPRYKALGNSMAVPVMRWIGRRIDAHTSPGKTHD